MTELIQAMKRSAAYKNHMDWQRAYSYLKICDMLLVIHLEMIGVKSDDVFDAVGRCAVESGEAL
jgi:hypothetical protein